MRTDNTNVRSNGRQGGRGTTVSRECGIAANHHDRSVTTEHESAAAESGATDVFRPAGLIRVALSLCWRLLKSLLGQWLYVRSFYWRRERVSLVQALSAWPSISLPNSGTGHPSCWPKLSALPAYPQGDVWRLISERASGSGTILSWRCWDQNSPRENEWPRTRAPRPHS
jgi:hypothetical protein